MNRRILSLRVNRRAVGAALLAGDALTLTDGRHLRSTRDRAVSTAVRYVNQLLTQAVPSAVVVDAPVSAEGSTTKHLLAAIVDALSSHGLIPLVVAKADIATAYGLSPVPTRL